MERQDIENNHLLKDMIKNQYEGKEGAKESIRYEQFQTKTITCDITGETCREGECCIGCNHRFTGEDEMYCKNCGLTKTECLDSIAVGERAYIYRKTTL